MSLTKAMQLYLQDIALNGKIDAICRLADVILPSNKSDYAFVGNLR